MNNKKQLSLPFPITSHTKYIGKGSIFVAINGFNENGIDYIPQAISNGAQSIIIQRDAPIPPESLALINKAGVTINRVDDPRLALAQYSAQAAGYPAKKLTIIGVTGTKGKTTTSSLLAHILNYAGFKTGLISTIKNALDSTTSFAPSLTTPQPDYLHQFFKRCLQANTSHIVMEISAQALSLQRTATIAFDGIIFTNFSHDHLEFYKTLDDYFSAKCLLFNQTKEKAPLVVNADDEYCKKIKLPNITWFGMHTEGDFIGNFVDNPQKQISLRLSGNNYRCLFTCPHLIGAFNGYNVLSSITMALKLGISPQAIKNALATFSDIPGRMEQHILPNKATAVIDYAHNPASYHAILSLLRSMTPHLIVVFGAGGNRDKSNRPRMGKIAACIADIVILTNDNPRTEDPQEIINDIVKGIPKNQHHKIVFEIDREKAIKKGYFYTKEKSILAILGKGTDEYQIIGNQKTYFSEKAILQKLKKL